MRESARTAAKSRTNLSTNSEKATKRLGRFAPNLAYMCKFIREWIYAKQIAPRDTRGALGGFRGPTIQQSGEAVRLVPTLIHVCGFICERTYAKYTSPHTTPGGISGVGGYRVSQIQKSREAVKWLDRLAPNVAHICRSIWEWIYTPNKLPLETQGGGHLGVLGGHQFKSLGKLSD